MKRDLATLCAIVGMSAATFIPINVNAFYFGDAGYISPWNNCHRTIRVEKGDTLSKIASKFCSDNKYVRDIAIQNSIQYADKIKIGQLIKLPGYCR